MAIVSLNSGATKNNDGLVQIYGTSEATVTRGGEFHSGPHSKVVEIIVALASLPTVASGDKQILAENVLLPNGAFVEQVETFVLKETAGATANFNLGLVDQDRSTEIDFDGLLAAADIFNGGTDLGSVTRYEKLDGTVTTEGGALIGTRLTNTGYLVGYADTADFTAGVLRIRIKLYFPLSADV
jgi:hypothetical protein